jgi:predicted RNA-binding protein associated with RNAse of E/G family
MSSVTVIKLDQKGQETWRYQGNVIERRAHHITLEAYFDREDTDVENLVLRRGDRFVETYFDDRWYNIFEVHDRVDDQIKGWYCNIGSPAALQDHTISYRDLALDLLVLPDGRQLVLDEDEFADLPLKPAERAKAWEALAELRKRFRDEGLFWLRGSAS